MKQLVYYLAYMLTLVLKFLCVGLFLSVVKLDNPRVNCTVSQGRWVLTLPADGAKGINPTHLSV